MHNMYGKGWCPLDINMGMSINEHGNIKLTFVSKKKKTHGQVQDKYECEIVK